MESMHKIHSPLNLHQKDSFYIRAVVHLLGMEHMVNLFRIIAPILWVYFGEEWEEDVSVKGERMSVGGKDFFISS